MAGLHRDDKSLNTSTSDEGEVIDEEDREFEVTWKTNEPDSFPEYSRTSMRELSELAKDNKITHLRFKHDYPDKLPSDVQNTLVWLDIPAKQRPAALSDLPSLRSLTVHRYGRWDYRYLDTLQWNVSDLTELEELILGGNYLMNDDHISETLSSLEKLKKLDLRNCHVLAFPSSISKLTELEELVFTDNDLSYDNPLGEILGSLKRLKKLDLSNNGLSAVPSSVSDLTELEELILTSNSLNNDAPFGELLSSLNRLKKLDLSNCRLSAVPSSISDLTELEELILDRNYLCNGVHLGEILSTLKKFKKLNLSYCSLSAFPTSISTLDQLEQLLIQGNRDLCKDKSLNSKLSQLKSLKTLNIGWCGLKEIPSGISTLNQLEHLLIQDNEDLCKDTPLDVSQLKSLKSLKTLNISKCGLREIPSDICTLDQLEHLLIQENRDLCKDKSLNSKLSQLKSLKTLNIGWCGLKEIPSGIKGMILLTDLNVAGNEISDDSIPTWFTELRSLKILNISGFKTLKKLPQTIVSLTKLDCDGCTALVEPPYFVCSGGINDIMQYYKDMEAGPKHSMTLSTIVVIGRKMAGKSSLVKSLTQKEITETLRDNFASGFHRHKKDETTKVFDLAKLKLTNGDDEYTVNVIDFGGDEIYHSAYLLTFRKDCIPAVVVNLEEFEKMSRQWGPREAARRLVFEWLAHLYLTCPDIGDPILVLTHIDTLQIRESACSYRDELVKTLDELLSDLKNQNAVSEKIGFFQKGFAAIEICEIRHDKPYDEVHKKLEAIVCRRASSSSVTLPNSWMEIITYIKDRDEASLLYDNMEQEMNPKGWSRKQLDVVLDFLQRAGEILRYQNKDRLRDIIFHRVEEVTKVIGLLFDHSISQYNGIVKADTLSRLLTPDANHRIEIPAADRGQIKAGTATELLKAFNLISGPKSYNGNPHCYLIPQLMSPYDFPVPTGDIQLRADMNFIGLSVPSYAYQRTTVTILESLPESETEFFPFGNGITCRVTKPQSDNHIEIHLIHETVEQRIRLRVEGCAEVITDMWRHLLNLIRDLTSSIRDVWPAAKITYELPCSHCLITNKLNPEKRTNPDFIIQASEGKLDRINYSTAQEKKECGDQSVPAALRSPVKEMSPRDLELLVAEVQKLKVFPSDEVKGLQTILKQQGNVLSMQPTLQTTLYSRPTSVPMVYRMTSSRGRALIINNKDTKIVSNNKDTKIVSGSQVRGRKGSENDFTNVKTMLESFGFVISDLSGDKDWTGKEMVDAIHAETQYVDRDTGSSVHDCLGMFVLVLMSHGGLGTITGCDGKILRLKDIYGLLSSYNFPAMKGKPKLIILQACSGVERERTDFAASAVPTHGQILPSAYRGAPDSITPQSLKRKATDDPKHCYSKQSKATVEAMNPIGAQADVTPPVQNRLDIPLPPEVDLDNSHLSVDDLLIMKPSFEDFVSFTYTYANGDKGSYFIRAVAAAFYLYAAEKDLRTLADTTIQEVVRAESKRFTVQLARHNIKQDVGQVPVTTCTFTKDRKLYLSPGVNMRTDHPESITNPRLPDRMTTIIRWKWKDPLRCKRSRAPRFDVEPNPKSITTCPLHN